MIDRNHPAVEAASMAEFEGREWSADIARVYGGGARREVRKPLLAKQIAAALPHLESATEDNLARLRDTPAGRALLAEGWDRGVADNERGWDHVYSGHDVDPDDPLAVCQTCETPNPYRT